MSARDTVTAVNSCSLFPCDPRRAALASDARRKLSLTPGEVPATRSHAVEGNSGSWGPKIALAGLRKTTENRKGAARRRSIQISGPARRLRHPMQHEPARQLLRQRGDGELVQYAEERAWRTLRSAAHAKEQLLDIEVFYDQRRMHSAIGYASPREFERAADLRAASSHTVHWIKPARRSDLRSEAPVRLAPSERRQLQGRIPLGQTRDSQASREDSQ